MSVRIQIKKHPNDLIIIGTERHGKRPAIAANKKEAVFLPPLSYSPKDKTFSALTRKTGDGLPFLDGLRFSKSSLETSTPLMK